MMTIFEEQKKKALERLRIMGADEEVEGIIEKLNRLENFYTTSSCSGRVALICIPEIGAKREAEFIGKWHRAVTKEEVSETIKTPKKGELWLPFLYFLNALCCIAFSNKHEVVTYFPSFTE